MPHVDVRDLGRVRDISKVLAHHGFGELLRATGMASDEDPIIPGSEETWAVRVRRVLVELGPTFIKLGQVLSVRPDIVPPDLMEELSKLQDKVPPAPWEDARAVLEEELTLPLEEIFETFEQTPVASASIAQVHFATLHDGSEVACKIQRPGIQQTLRSDLHILYSLAHLADGRLNLPGVYTPVAIVQEFERALLQELDFIQEAHNAARFREQLRGAEGVIAPRIIERLTSSRVLVMERVSGAPLSALAPGDPRVELLMDRLIDASFAQVFDHGFFHGDPHPGNLFLTDEGELAYLDFGLCGTLTPGMRDVLINAFTALVFEDAEGLALTIYRAGGTHGRVDLRAFRAEIERLMHKYHGAHLSDLGTASLTEFIQVASRYQIRLRPEYAVLARMASLIDGIARRLIPDADMVKRVRPFAQQMIARRMAPERLAADAARMLSQAQSGLRELPTQLNQLLLDLERGRLTVMTRDPEAAITRDEIRQAVLRLTMAAIAASLLIAGSILLAAWSPAPFGVPLVAVLMVVVLGSAALTWVALVAHLLFGDQLRPRELQRHALAVARFFIGDH